MSARTHRGAIVLYVLAVVAGAAIGIAVDRTLLVERRGPGRPDPREMRRRFYDDLSLSPAQRAQMDTILEQRSTAYRTLMAPLRPQQDSIAAEARARMVALLTPSQRETYERLQREREQRSGRRSQESR